MNKIAVLVCAALLLPLLATAQAPEQAAAGGLDGVKTIFLVIQDLQQELVTDGMQAEDLQAEVRGLLQDGGLEVAELTDVPDPATVQGTLRLAIEGTIASTANRIYGIRLEFRQRVSLARDPGIKLAATTWYAGDFGMSTRKDMLEIRSSVRDLIGKFLADCQAANPKPEK